MRMTIIIVISFFTLTVLNSSWGQEQLPDGAPNSVMVVAPIVFVKVDDLSKRQISKNFLQHIYELEGFTPLIGVKFEGSDFKMREQVLQIDAKIQWKDQQQFCFESKVKDLKNQKIIYTLEECNISEKTLIPTVKRLFSTLFSSPPLLEIAKKKN